MNARLIPMAGLLALLAACQATPTPPEAYTESTTDEAVQPATFERYGTLTVAAGTEDKPLDMRLWYARPDQVTPNTPVVLVMHGGRRDADNYRDYWGPYAKKYNVLVVAPEVTQKAFPTGWGYQTGNWVSRDSSSIDASKGHRNPVEETSFAAVNRAFESLCDRLGLNATTYDIWGHGSGAQFVARMVMLYPQAHIRTAVAANSGTYTFPDWSLPLRYGLKNTGVAPEDLAPAYAHHLVIMLGEEDNDPSHRLLSKLDIAEAQGAHRLAKGKNFFAANKAMAEKLGVPFNWELRTVYGIGHSGSKMSEPGARYLLAGKAEEPLFPLKPRAKTPPADETPRQREQRQRNQELLRGSGTDGEASPF
ncbi:hypothetical protein LL252_01340 [Alcanivorax marinus]|uniref:Alpha/beta hydrolase n=1 Tax=Alloalcanivorax marinus TaxID=1177169 RepID=A0A9Q3YMU0_9GAMM|nr:hypothetical protein [Alloalcanivorax marinus]MCC4307200.1 hypothetical protein [Alloalcanivorax marinus]